MLLWARHAACCNLLFLISPLADRYQADTRHRPRRPARLGRRDRRRVARTLAIESDGLITTSSPSTGKVTNRWKREQIVEVVKDGETDIVLKVNPGSPSTSSAFCGVFGIGHQRKEVHFTVAPDQREEVVTRLGALMERAA